MAHTWIARDFGGPDVFDFVEEEVRPPGPGEVTIEILAAGMNPADYKHVAMGGDPADLPIHVGYEVAGFLTAVGPETEIASGGGAVGDEVLAFRIRGGYSDAVTVPAKDVFAKPESLDFPQAANLLLAGTTAAEMLEVTGAQPGETIVVHGASGAVGVSVLQQARLRGIRTIGTAGEHNAGVVTLFGGEHVVYGDGLEERVRELAAGPVAAALDCVGTDEAIDVSLALVADRSRIVSIANFERAESDGYRVIMGRFPASAVFRDRIRAHLIELAGRGDLVVPVARTFPLAEAREAMAFLADQHPGGKIALLP
ncbi:quinone oxidoreductase family protein [Labedella endophytica]|uniref:NADP-dependent oxidoreductase n=1 Tax=Labedella endophytica TaxID=1523160 RepID=A0A3S0WY39_9MICO|nr:NADP-dependent oxidoreductase [Labedella endophytica]RUR00872.1 NADP-dependent oxidoreductase [Labedella endophytica]